VISKWTALEYSVCATPINEEAEVLAVSKAFEDIDQIVPDTFVKDYIQILRSVDIPSLVARTLRRMQGKLD
jgi:aminoglycoside N3'-acetyltransferase